MSKPLRVAMFSRYPLDHDRPRGGIESVTVVLARALACRDIDVHVVTLEPGRTRACTEADGPVKVHRLAGSCWPQIVDVHCGPGRVRLCRYLREQLQPDVLHAHETYGLRLADYPAGYVFTVHGFDDANLQADRTLGLWGRLRVRLWRRAMRGGLARQTDIISINPYVRGMLEPLTQARIHDIDNPVDARFFDIDREPARRSNNHHEHRVLCTGWLNERKNPLGAVAAFAAARRMGTAGTLVFAGSAKQPGYINCVRSAAQAAGVAEHVEFLGHVDRDRLTAELARARVLLLPSRQENAPMAVAEAMAAGLPVIASNRCGMKFMVEDGQSGFLIDPENPQQIGDRLARLLADESLCGQMGRRGRALARERFNPDVVADRTMEVYRVALESRRS